MKDKVILPENVPLKTVYFVREVQMIGGTSTSRSGWATLDKGSSLSHGYDSIIMVGGHTLILRKGGERRLIPWASVLNAEELIES